MSTVSILDARGAVLKTVHTDAHDPDRQVEVMTVDLDPFLRHVEFQREHHRDVDGMKLAAYIPPDVVERMMRDGSFNDEAALRKWANDPQNACFRVWKGRI